MAPHSSTLAWKIPWMEEPGRLWSMGSLRVGHDWATSLSLFSFTHWRRKWQPTPVFLPGESQGWGSLVGLQSMGSHRVGHDWSDLAAAEKEGKDLLRLHWSQCTSKENTEGIYCVVWLLSPLLSDMHLTSLPSLPSTAAHGILFCLKLSVMKIPDSELEPQISSQWVNLFI